MHWAANNVIHASPPNYNYYSSGVLPTGSAYLTLRFYFIGKPNAKGHSVTDNKPPFLCGVT